MVVPPSTRLTPVSVNVSAGHESDIAGAIENTPLPPSRSLLGPLPVDPVSPTAVTVKFEPTDGAVVEALTLVTLFALAEITLMIWLKPSV